MNIVDYYIIVSFFICICRIYLILLLICIFLVDIINVIILVMILRNLCEIYNYIYESKDNISRRN